MTSFVTSTPVNSSGIQLSLYINESVKSIVAQHRVEDTTAATLYLPIASDVVDLTKGDTLQFGMLHNTGDTDSLSSDGTANFIVITKVN